MLALCGAMIFAPPPAAASQNLIHYWAFDTDGIVEDEGTGGARNGTLAGGARVSGGELLLEKSTAHVQFEAHLVPASPSYTVALFARAAPGANSGANRDLISQGAAGGAFFIGAALDGHSLRAGDSWSSVAGGSFISDGDYHHYAITMSANESSFYVDGALVSSSAPFAGGSGGTATRFGRGVGGATQCFNGALDEVRIYDYALSAEEIRELATSPRMMHP